MSSLERRRRDLPRRRFQTGGMEPAWACFLWGHISGLATIAAMIGWVSGGDVWSFLIPGAIAVGFFVAGARRADQIIRSRK